MTCLRWIFGSLLSKWCGKGLFDSGKLPVDATPLYRDDLVRGELDATYAYSLYRNSAVSIGLGLCRRSTDDGEPFGATACEFGKSRESGSPTKASRYGLLGQRPELEYPVRLLGGEVPWYQPA